MEALTAAELLARQGWGADAISRAYYAILHAAKAALLVHEVAAESHSAVRRLVGVHLVQTGALEREWAAILAHSLDDRLSADYDVEVSFSRAEASEECRRARKFLKRIRDYLISHGFKATDLRMKKANS